jgi:hypothetical protein
MSKQQLLKACRLFNRGEHWRQIGAALGIGPRICKRQVESGVGRELARHQHQQRRALARRGVNLLTLDAGGAQVRGLAMNAAGFRALVAGRLEAHLPARLR